MIDRRVLDILEWVECSWLERTWIYSLAPAMSIGTLSDFAHFSINPSRTKALPVLYLYHTQSPLLQAVRATKFDRISSIRLRLCTLSCALRRHSVRPPVLLPTLHLRYVIPLLNNPPTSLPLDYTSPLIHPFSLRHGGHAPHRADESGEIRQPNLWRQQATLAYKRAPLHALAVVRRGPWGGVVRVEKG